MPRAVLVVQSRPSSPDREAEYVDWYNNVHIPDLCQVPGIVSGRHFRLSDAQIGGSAHASAYPYLAVYELDADDIGGVFREMSRLGSEGRFRRSDSLQMDPPPITTCYVLSENDPRS
jgi:hypothetical protein